MPNKLENYFEILMQLHDLGNSVKYSMFKNSPKGYVFCKGKRPKA